MLIGLGLTTLAQSGVVASVATAALNTTNGVNKDNLLTVTGTPALSFSGSSANGNNSVRSTVQQTSNKAQVELTVTTVGTSIVLGFDDGTTDFNNAPRGMPGLDGFSGGGIGLAFYSSGGAISLFYNLGATQTDILVTAGAWAAGDVFTLVYDKSANTAEVWRTRSGTTIQIGSTVTSLTVLSAQYCYVGTRSSTSSGSVNFGNSPYTKTPGSGVASYWGP